MAKGTANIVTKPAKRKITVQPVKEGRDLGLDRGTRRTIAGNAPRQGEKGRKTLQHGRPQAEAVEHQAGQKA
eukprot:6593109-Pyramimonas_sp.AAC.1